MKRQLTALLLMLAVGLQGSLVFASAVTPSTLSDCQASAQSHHQAASHECCPAGGFHASCCPDACTASAAITSSPRLGVWNGRTAHTVQFRTANFSSRGELPPIRPPIL